MILKISRGRTVAAFIASAFLTVGVSVVTPYAQAAGDDAPSAGVRSAIKDFVAKQRGSFPASFQFATTDLNGDAVSDALVLLSGSDWCGTGGCTLLVLKGGGQESFSLLSSTTVADNPVRVASSKQLGVWAPILVYSGHRGDMYLTYSSKGYPSNATSARKASKADANSSTALITSGSHTFQMDEKGDLMKEE